MLNNFLEEYEAMPAYPRYEVYDGVLKAMASPSQAHQTILLELAAIFRTFFRGKRGPCQPYLSPFDVKLKDKPPIIVQPDLMVICDKSKLDGKRCNGAPDFVIEVVSPSNPRDDYIHKLILYARYGTREYWIVDPLRKHILVYNLEGISESTDDAFWEDGFVEGNLEKDNVLEEEYSDDTFSLKSYSFSETVYSHIFDGLSVDFSEIKSELENLGLY